MPSKKKIIEKKSRKYSKPKREPPTPQPIEDRPSVMVVCVNNSGMRNEYSCNAMYGMGWVLGSAGIKTLSYTFDAHPISLARNEAVKEFLESPFKFTHLFFIDSDSVPKADIIVRLLQHKKPVASGWYLDRGGHGLPVVLKIIAKNTPKCVACLVKHPEKFPEWRAYKLDELLIGQKEKNSSLVKVDGVGAGCLLIERDVFSKLEKPYFYEDHLSVHSFGEDLWFGLNCKVHRIPIYVDLNALVEHWSWGLIGERHVKALLQKSIRDKMQAKAQGKPI